MQILAIYGLIRSISSNMGTIFQAGGKPQWLTSIAAWRFVTMTVLLYPSIKWAGLVGVCVLSAGVAIVDFFIAAYLADKILKARMVTYAQMLTPIFIYAILAGATGYLVQQWLSHRAVGHRYACGSRPGRGARVRRLDLVARSGGPPGSSTSPGAD